jgi:hypothetical protein
MAAASAASAAKVVLLGLEQIPAIELADSVLSLSIPRIYAGVCSLLCGIY